MFKTLGLATVATIAAGSASDFPKFDHFHANCAMITSYAEPCSTLYPKFTAEIASWSKGGPSNGLYS